jgi:hypothetical protein
VENFFPWRGKVAKYFSMAWKSLEVKKGEKRAEKRVLGAKMGQKRLKYSVFGGFGVFFGVGRNGCLGGVFWGCIFPRRGKLFSMAWKIPQKVFHGVENG